MNFKKTLAVLCTAAVLAGTVTGCSDQAEKPENGTQKNPTEPQYAYQATFIPLTTPEGEPLDSAYGECFIGNKLYFTAYYTDGKTQAINEITGEPETDPETGAIIEYDNYTCNVLSYDLASDTISKLDYAPAELPEGALGNSNIDQIFPGANDTLWIYEQVYTYSFDLPEDFDLSTGDPYEYYTSGETQNILTQYGTDGGKQNTVTLQLDEDMYLYHIYALSDGRFLSHDWQNLYFFAADGTLSETVALEDSNDLVSLGNDRFVMASYDSNTQQQALMELNLETRQMEKLSDLPINAYTVYPGFGEYDYLYRNSDSIYGLPVGGTEGEMLLSCLDCDIDSNNIENVCCLEDGRIAAVESVYDNNGANVNLILLERVDAATIPQKQMLTLGCLNLDWELRTQIVNFNRTHDDIRIRVTDYSELVTDGNYDLAQASALQKLTTEILSGNVPDILCTDGLPVAQYAAKGLLMDLWPLIDNDDELSREDLMTHFFDVLSIDSKLYQVTDSFCINTAATYESIAKGRTSWTLDEMLQELDALGEGAAIFGETDTSDYMLRTMVSFNLDSFMDWTTGTCSFDSDEFVDILNFAARFPKEFNYDNYDWDSAESEYSRLKNGKQLLLNSYMYSYDSVQFNAGVLDNQACYIGYPSSNGNGSGFSFSGCLAISSTCENPEAAWSLVRTLLLQENQEKNLYQFPTNKHAFETYTKQAMTAEYTTDPETGEQVEVSTGGIGYNDFMVELYSVKQADYDAFMSLYENCSTITASDEEVMELILTNAAAFLDGQKTAEETARLIQDSVSLYMMEQG